MVLAEPQRSMEDLASITAPTLVLQGDRDDVRPEHGAAVAEALPEGRLAVLPGTHGLPIESPAIVNALILEWPAGGPAGPDWAKVAGG